MQPGDMYIRDHVGVVSSVLYGPDDRTRIVPGTRRVVFCVYAPAGSPQRPSSGTCRTSRATSGSSHPRRRLPTSRSTRRGRVGSVPLLPGQPLPRRHDLEHHRLEVRTALHAAAPPPRRPSSAAAARTRPPRWRPCAGPRPAVDVHRPAQVERRVHDTPPPRPGGGRSACPCPGWRPRVATSRARRSRRWRSPPRRPGPSHSWSSRRSRMWVIPRARSRQTSRRKIGARPA